jgi:cell division protein FtsL
MANKKDDTEKKAKNKKKKNKRQKAAVTKKTFLGVVAVGICALVILYVFVYMDYNEKTQTVKASNSSIRSSIEQLQVYYDNIGQYQEAIEDMEEQIIDSLEAYPADAREEDVIMLAVNLQEENDIKYSSISIDSSDTLYEIPDSIITPLEMEGYTTGLSFSKRNANYANTTDYSNLKSVIEDIFDSPNRIGINSISYSKNDEEATLEGSISLSFYSASGTGKEYIAPSMASYQAGTSDMFKTGSTYNESDEGNELDDSEKNIEEEKK